MAGLSFLDHTADVGIAVEAPSPEILFHLAALGMLALLRGEDDADPVAPGSAHPRPSVPSSTSLEIEAVAAGWAELLAAWLRELLFLHETQHRDYANSNFDRLEPTSLRARVGTQHAAPAVREIKGVTYHGLVVERDDRGWRAQVIFDV